MPKSLQLDEEILHHSKGQNYATLYGTAVIVESPSAQERELEEKIVCLKVTLAVLFLCMVVGFVTAALVTTKRTNG